MLEFNNLLYFISLLIYWKNIRLVVLINKTFTALFGFISLSLCSTWWWRFLTSTLRLLLLLLLITNQWLFPHPPKLCKALYSIKIRLERKESRLEIGFIVFQIRCWLNLQFLIMWRLNPRKIPANFCVHSTWGLKLFDLMLCELGQRRKNICEDLVIYFRVAANVLRQWGRRFIPSTKK